MIKYLLLLVVISTLWTTCLSQSDCSSTINETEIVFTCLSNITINELPLYDYTSDDLANITSIIVNGIDDNTPGPFTSIPPNICLLSNLESIDFSYNRINQVDPVDVLSRCLSFVTTLDVSFNRISQFPSAMIYNMPTLQNLYFQYNQLTEIPSNSFMNVSNLVNINFSYNNLTTFDLWALITKTVADFSHNQISTITNKLFFDMPLSTTLEPKTFYLNNNGPIINLTDAIYEMYNSCDEVIETLQLPGSQGLVVIPAISYNLASINFGATQINCNCEQAYILQMLEAIFSQLSDTAGFPIYNASCTDGSRFVFSSCAPNMSIRLNSTTNFAQVYPRQCKIYDNEDGILTTIPNIPIPTLNVSTYPHYETASMNPGACFFTFSNINTVRIKCTNDTTSDSSTIPATLLSTTYFSTVTRIDFTAPISSLPSYLCSLPSGEIDLSYQAFTTLNDQTFPCLDSFQKVTLSNNQLTSVNMASGNFTTLIILDLSSNRLTVIPYSIINPTPTSLRFLDLRNNSITLNDLYLYTLENITIDLRDNPINSSSIINSQNITIPSRNNTNSTAIIILPSSVTNSTHIFNDQEALTAGTCNRNTVLTYRNILQSIYNNVVLDCSCASINLKEIFLRSGSNITDSFTCSNGTSATNFYTLTMSSCASSAVNFSSGPCYNESLQTSTDETTMGIVNTTVSITSTSLTIIINSSLSTNVTQSQQYTSLPGFEQTGLSSYTLPTINNSNQLSTISMETITSNNFSYSVITSISMKNTSDQMDTTLIINTTATMTDSVMTTTIAWTTTTTTSTTSTSTSTSTSTTSTTTSRTTSTSSTSTSTSTSTTTSRTTSSTSTSTTSRTTSTSSTSTSTSTSTTTSVTTSSTSTSTTSTSATTSTSSTSTTTTSVTTTSTSTSTSTSTTSTSATTSSSSTSASTATSTSTSTTTTVTTAVTISDGSVQSSSGQGDSNSSRTGLIVGLVLGLVGFFAIVGGLIAAIVITKSKNAKMNKSIGRATAISQAPQNALLQSRLQTRNLRSVRLAPLAAQPSQLPPPAYGLGTPVTVTTDPLTATPNRSSLRTSARGIPVRPDPIRSPSNVVPQYTRNSYASNDSFNFQPESHSSTIQHPSPQQPQESTTRQPRPNQLLNMGGDNRY